MKHFAASSCVSSRVLCFLVIALINEFAISVEIKIATILPANDSRLFSIRRVAPAMEIAMDHVSKSRRLLKGYTFSVKYEDSDCDIAEGINKAIKFYMQREVNAFFGPVCDYALAPVARQAIFWNIPVISAGGMAMDFTSSKLKEYRSLTRVGMFNFVSLYQFFIGVMNYFNWKKFKIIYDKSGQDSIATGFCHLTTSSIHYGIISEAPDIQQSFYRLDQANSIQEMMEEEIGQSSAALELTYITILLYLRRRILVNVLGQRRDMTQTTLTPALLMWSTAQPIQYQKKSLLHLVSNFLVRM